MRTEMLDTGTVGENALVWQVEATFTSAAKGVELDSVGLCSGQHDQTASR